METSAKEDINVTKSIEILADGSFFYILSNIEIHNLT